MKITCDSLDQASEVFAALNNRYSNAEPGTQQAQQLALALMAAHAELNRQELIAHDNLKGN